MKTNAKIKPIALLVLFAIALILFFWDAKSEVIYLRFHRWLIILLVGTALSISGFILQNVLKNPLAEPYIIGISSTGALAYAITIVLHIGFPADNLITLLGIVIGFVIVLSISRSTTDFILIGVAINMFSGALLSLLMATFGEDVIRTFYIIWGSVDRILTKFEVQMLYISVLVVLMGALVVFKRRKTLAIVSLPRDEAISMGINPLFEERLFIVVSFILTGLSVYWAGNVGFVGLIIPHTLKILFKDEFGKILVFMPITATTLLMLSDVIIRLLPTNIPIGIITSIVGVPFFIALVKGSVSASRI